MSINIPIQTFSFQSDCFIFSKCFQVLHKHLGGLTQGFVKLRFSWIYCFLGKCPVSALCFRNKWTVANSASQTEQISLLPSAAIFLGKCPVACLCFCRKWVVGNSFLQTEQVTPTGTILAPDKWHCLLLSFTAQIFSPILLWTKQ